MSLPEKQKPGVARHSDHPAETPNLLAASYSSHAPFTSENKRLFIADLPTPRLTAEETARWLRLAPCTVRRLARWGRIPAMRVGGRWTFSIAEIEGVGKGECL